MYYKKLIIHSSMRPLIIQVPKGNGKTVLEKAREFKGKNVSLLNGADAEKALDIIIVFIPNKKIEGLISALDSSISGLQVTIFPQGVMPLYPPADQAPDQVTDVEPRSPIEIFLSGLQSKGSWKGFIGYAVIASIIVWIGLFTNTSFLLVAAMLIAPFAGPAMNTAIATARGDWKLLRQGLLRYFVSLLVTIAGACLLSIILQQEIATPLMVDRSQVSSVAVLLALAAGAAGALNLVQSERDSLVSGAATGMLVAASLAPPAGVIGMSIAIGKWDMTKSGLFLLVLQLVGINLTGSLIFRLFGLSSKGPRYKRGKKMISKVSLMLTFALLGMLLFWQFNQTPDLQRSSTSQRAIAEIQKIVEENKDVALVESNARFTRANIQGQSPLLCVIYVQKKKQHSEASSEAIKKQLTRSIQQGLLQRGFDVTPLVEVAVLEAPL